MVAFEPERMIDCIDCGGRCHLISFAPEDGWRAGDLVTYRCRDCLDRWDLLLPGGDDDTAGDSGWERR